MRRGGAQQRADRDRGRAAGASPAPLGRAAQHLFIGETDTITDLADGFLGAGLGGLFLAAWAMTRYTIRRLPHRLERALVKAAV